MFNTIPLHEVFKLLTPEAMYPVNVDTGFEERRKIFLIRGGYSTGMQRTKPFKRYVTDSRNLIISFVCELLC